MIFALLCLLALADEEVAGIHSPHGAFLPLVPKEVLDGRGLLLDYPDFRIPIKRLFRFVSSFAVTGKATFGLQKVFGQIIELNDATSFVMNFSSFGVGGRLSSEDQTTFVNLCELSGDLDPNSYRLNIWAKVTGENGQNSSVLLFNETADFYEVIDIKDQIGSAVLYIFFVGVVGGILYWIYIRKDKPTNPDQPVRKQRVRDYSEIHGVTVPPADQSKKGKSPSPAKKGQSPSPDRKTSPDRKASPKK